MSDEDKTKADLIKELSSLRRKAEEAIKSERGYFEKMINSLGEAVFSVKMPERVIKYVNCSVEKIFGYKPEECIGHSTDMFYPEEEGFIDFGRKLKDAIAQGEDVLRTEHLLKRKNGEIFPSGITVTFLRKAGEITEVISIVSDITERRRIEEEMLRLREELETKVVERTAELTKAIKELKKSEESLARAQQIARLGNWKRDIKSDNVFWSDEIYHIFSVNKDQFKPTYDAVLNFIHPDDRKSVNEAVESALSGNKPIGIDYRIVLSNGIVKNIRSEAEIVFDDAGNVVGLRGTVQDITERKKAEKLLSLQYKIVSILAENAELDKTLKETIKAVCEHVGWELGDVWYVDRDADVLRLGEIWHADFIDASEMETLSRKTVFKIGEGILGLVWQKGEPIWVEDISVQSHLIRARIVAGMGFKSAFAFPVIVSNTVNGVMIVTGRTMQPPDKDLLSALSAAGSQIGGFIERKKAEEDLQLSAEILANTNDSIFLLDFDGNFIYVNETALKSRGYTRDEFMRMNLRTIDTPDCAALIGQRMAELKEKGVHIFESAHYRKDGSVMPIEVNARIVELGGRRVILSVIRDITVTRSITKCNKQGA